MRKSDPDGVVESFIGGARESATELQDVLAALQVAGVGLKIRQGVAQDTFLRTAVQFEVFKSDWIIAAVNRQPERFRTHLISQVHSRVGSSSDLKPVTDRVRLDLPSRLWPQHTNRTSNSRTGRPQPHNFPGFSTHLQVADRDAS